jgi:uncharacterized membrane protein YkoI
MTKRTKIIAATAVVLAAGLGSGIAIAGGGDDDGGREDAEQERPIRAGDDRDRASEVALRHVGEGRVTETEVGDEESYYEVEVTRDDGSQVDVQLDRDFNVVGSEADRAGEDE